MAEAHPGVYRARTWLVALASTPMFACADPVKPPERAPSGSPPALQQQAQMSYGIPVPASNDVDIGKISFRSTGIVIPAYTTVRITVRGRIELSPNPAATCCFANVSYPGAGRSTGPTGFTEQPFFSTNRLRVRLYAPGELFYPAGVNEASDSVSWTWHYNEETPVMVARDGVEGGFACTHTPLPSDTTAGNCTCPGGPCFNYSAGAYALSGEQTVSVTILDNPLTLTANPTSGVPGTQVTFTPQFTGGGYYLIRSWQWIPDDSTGTDSTSACPTNNLVCTRPIYRSGRMRVVASPHTGVMWDWKRYQAEAYVQIPVDSVVLTAEPRHIGAGERVLFEPSTQLGSPFTIVNWTWFPLSQSDSTAACTPDHTTCETEVFGSGHMVVQVMVNGQLQSAAAHVDVHPLACPTGDPLLDDPTVRRGLIKRLKAGHPDTTEQHRREKGGLIEEWLPGRFHVIPLELTNATQCRGGFSVPDGIQNVRAWMHTHVFALGDTVYHCSPLPRVYDHGDDGWAGPDDWAALDSLTSSTGTPRPMYIIDKTHVVKLDPSWPVHLRFINPYRYDWNTPECQWDLSTPP